ncbi:energy-coupling factor transporter transmembrane component T family protein [Microbacterium esteraromaticum]|uniref:energy-coupling factor transporter transmembrane component T family protein n=1 Tax=Microbacterium esteraromaticum TaxID=57043 RepID=UPI0019D401E9|nr:energy-coupling factor transporter transmembrane component T [Microbacterium esteraromaticum]MBN7792353.1 energy-coupling factor transporter transmembrane protein EcfT [Microbacterium esteraromaticum]
MISLYRPGTGILHRRSAGAKLGLLAALALCVSVLPLGTTGTVILVAAVSSLYVVGGLGWRLLAESWWRLRWLIIVLAAALWIFVGLDEAVRNAGRVVALILLADLVTRTTRMGDLLDVLQRLLRPLRVFRLDPETAALAISLTIAMVPVLAGFLNQVRDAQRARGVRLGPRAALPLLVLTLRHADDVGDALAARGLAR